MGLRWRVGALGEAGGRVVEPVSRHRVIRTAPGPVRPRTPRPAPGRRITTDFWSSLFSVRMRWSSDTLPPAWFTQRANRRFSVRELMIHEGASATSSSARGRRARHWPPVFRPRSCAPSRWSASIRPPTTRTIPPWPPGAEPAEAEQALSRGHVRILRSRGAGQEGTLARGTPTGLAESGSVGWASSSRPFAHSRSRLSPSRRSPCSSSRSPARSPSTGRGR